MPLPEPLKIEPTETTPYVCFNTNNVIDQTCIFEISGESRHENVKSFYESLLNWLQLLNNSLHTENAETAGFNKLRLVFKTEYFNTSSSKYFLEIIQRLSEIDSAHDFINAEVWWYYYEDDEIMKDAGEAFAQMIHIPVKLIAE
jgi:hypothetical protein